MAIANAAPGVPEESRWGAWAPWRLPPLQATAVPPQGGTTVIGPAAGRLDRVRQPGWEPLEEPAGPLQTKHMAKDGSSLAVAKPE